MIIKGLRVLIWIVIVLSLNVETAKASLTFPTGKITDYYGHPMDFEEYIKRVLAGELGYDNAHPEALKALAIAARCI